MNKSNQRGNFLPWLWFILTLLCGTGGFTLFLINMPTSVPASWGVDAGPRQDIMQASNAFLQGVFAPAVISLLGVVILSQRVGHRIGRLLIMLGLVSAIGILTQEWAVYSYYTAQIQLWGSALAAWTTNWIWIFIFGLLLFTGAIFPDGQFSSRTWGWIIMLPLMLFVLPMFAGSAIEHNLSSAFQIANPLIRNTPAQIYDTFFYTGLIFMPVSALLILSAAFDRFRSSHTRLRAQMKWFLFGVFIMASLTVFGLVLVFGLGNSFGGLIVNSAVMGPPLGIAIALLRHQLYDIDIIIRRTLQYFLLTGMLVATYLVLVTVLQSIFSGFSNQQSTFAIVISTLVIAALFNPLRQQIQVFIDRRFYRQKYDAQKALQTFGVITRNETDLGNLSDHLSAIVTETMQPETVEIWLTAEDR